MNKKLLLLMLSGFIVFSTTSCDSLLNNLPMVSNSESAQPSTSQEQEDVVLDQQFKIYQLATETGYYGSYEQWLNLIKNDSIMLAVIDNSIQWKTKSDSQWIKLIELENLNVIENVDGKAIDFRVLNGYLQYRYDKYGDKSWYTLFQMNNGVIYDTITVTFDPKNGQESFTQPVIPGYSVKEPQAIEYDGYIFDGWYCQGTSDVWKFDYFSTSKDITLEARWIKKEPETSEDRVPSIDKTEPITVWATASEENVIKRIVDEWNKTHDAINQFNVNFVPVAEGDCGNILSKDNSSEDSPALFLCADDYISTLVSNGSVAKLTDESRYLIESNNTELSVAGVTKDDAVWGYPVTSDNGYFMWYNKKYVNEEKVGNLEELLAYAHSMGKTVLMDVANGWYANSFIMSPQACGVDSLKWYTNSNGENYYETTWDNEVGVKVSEYIANLLTPYYMDGTLIIGSNDMIQSGFASGSMIAAVSGIWMENILKQEIGNNLAADKLPKYHIDGQAYQMATFGGSKVYCINNAKSEGEQKTAAALAELLTNKEGQLVRFEERGSLPCNLQAANDPRYTENVSVGGAALAKQSAYACVQAQTAEWRYWSVGQTIGQAYIDNQLNGKTWAEFLTEQMNQLRGKEYEDVPVLENQLFIIGSHWNSWDVFSIYDAYNCKFDDLGKYHELTIEITKEMLEEWVGFKFVMDNSWTYQLGMEDVDWDKSNEAFRELFPEGKEIYTESSFNRSNIVPSQPGVMVIRYYPNNVYTEYLENGSTHTKKLVIQFYPK